MDDLKAQIAGFEHPLFKVPRTCTGTEAVAVAVAVLYGKTCFDRWI